MYTPGDLILDQSYRIDGELGRGAFGVVYRATHLTLNVERAVKVLCTDDDGVGSSVFTEYRNRFRLEAQLAARLTHPHVIQVYDFQEREGVLYCVMEYASGGSLADLLATQEPLPVAQAVALLLDAAAGLAALHDQLNAVHRDVKPANLLLDRQGRVKVADLGLAQVSGLGMSQRSQLGSMSLPHPGTPNYTSPEHRDGSEPLGPTADVYGLGCVAFELLTGQVWKLARRKVKRPSDLRTEIPAWLDAVVVRMVCQEPGLTVDDADDPAKRYVDMEGVIAALRAGAEQARQEAAARAAEEKRRQEAAEQERQRIAAEQARQEAAARAAEEDKRKAAAEAARQREEEAAAAALKARNEAAARERERLRPIAITPSIRPIDHPVLAKLGMEMVLIPAGPFLMGSDPASDSDAGPDEQPQHEVYLDAYRISRTPVTVAQFAAFVEATGYVTIAEKEGNARTYDGDKYGDIKGTFWRHPRGPQSDVSKKANHPVTCVSWDDAVAFCRWANVRLPTEAQWEKAARGVDGRLYPWGNTPPDKSRCNFSNHINDTAPVDAYPAGASPYGVLDMAGNVREWCSDWYAETAYQQNDRRNPTGPASGSYRLVRGGALFYGPKFTRCASRRGCNPILRRGWWGFRVVFPCV